ncbi:hypothetical protein [Peribacillus sp. NPDC097895]
MKEIHKALNLDDVEDGGLIHIDDDRMREKLHCSKKNFNSRRE